MKSDILTNPGKSRFVFMTKSRLKRYKIKAIIPCLSELFIILVKNIPALESFQNTDSFNFVSGHND